jgi:hypothetical protein
MPVVAVSIAVIVASLQHDCLPANAEHIFEFDGNVEGDAESVILPENPATLPKFASAFA